MFQRCDAICYCELPSIMFYCNPCTSYVHYTQNKTIYHEKHKVLVLILLYTTHGTINQNIWPNNQSYMEVVDIRTET